ncbi:MAG TPA: hypothetical protein VIK86_04210 [Candidatus Paceibacterota bacterium]
MCRCKIDNHIWGITWSNLQKYGCPVCYVKRESGENSYLWKGGITPLSHRLRGKIQQWRVDSFIKYNSKCDITKNNKECQIHHFHNFSDILIETLETLFLPIYQDISKYKETELKSIEELCLKLHYKYGLGVCLCKEEHKLFHIAYGIKNNTKEQYIEFKKSRLQLNNNLLTLK